MSHPLESGPCDCLINRIWWKLCYAIVSGLKKLSSFYFLSLETLALGAQSHAVRKPNSHMKRSHAGVQADNQLRSQLTASIRYICKWKCLHTIPVTSLWVFLAEAPGIMSPLCPKLWGSLLLSNSTGTNSDNDANLFKGS